MPWCILHSTDTATLHGRLHCVHLLSVCWPVPGENFTLCFQVWPARRVSSMWSTTPPTMSWCAPRPWWSPASCRSTPPLSGSGTRLTTPPHSAARRASNWWVLGVNAIEMGRGLKGRTFNVFFIAEELCPLMRKIYLSLSHLCHTFVSMAATQLSSVLAGTLVLAFFGHHLLCTVLRSRNNETGA